MHLIKVKVPYLEKMVRLYHDLRGRRGHYRSVADTAPVLT